MPTATQKPNGVAIARFAPLWSRPFDIKNADYEVNRSKGVVSGYMTLYDDPLTQQPYVDTYKDVVLPGCFNRTINRLGEAMRFKSDEFLLPYLWQHDPKELIGGVKHLGEDSKGVVFENKLNLRVKRADEALALMEEGMLRGISYGYDPIQAIPQNGLRYLKEARLHELSSVTFPAHEWAQVSDIKSLLWEYDDVGNLLNIPETHKTYHFLNLSPLKNEIKGQDFSSIWSSMEPDTLMSQLYTMLDSFTMALFENIHDENLSDKAGAIDVITSQFTDVLKQWLPTYASSCDNQGQQTVMGDGDVTPSNMSMGMMSNILLHSFKNALELKSGRVLSKNSVSKLITALNALKLTTGDLEGFLANHQPVDDEQKKATELLLQEIKNRLPLFKTPLATSPSQGDTTENTVQLDALTADMKGWLKH